MPLPLPPSQPPLSSLLTSASDAFRGVQEGSSVLQLVCSEVATNAQKHAMYTEMWGREFALFKVP